MKQSKINSYLKEITDLYSIDKKFTLYIAQHTFDTTVMLSNGISIETVSKMLGDKILEQHTIPLKIIAKKVSNDMMLLREKFKSQEIVLLKVNICHD